MLLLLRCFDGLLPTRRPRPTRLPAAQSITFSSVLSLLLCLLLNAREFAISSAPRIFRTLAHPSRPSATPRSHVIGALHLLANSTDTGQAASAAPAAHHIASTQHTSQDTVDPLCSPDKDCLPHPHSVSGSEVCACACCRALLPPHHHRGCAVLPASSTTTYHLRLYSQRSFTRSPLRRPQRATSESSLHIFRPVLPSPSTAIPPALPGIQDT